MPVCFNSIRLCLGVENSTYALNFGVRVISSPMPKHFRTQKRVFGVAFSILSAGRHYNDVQYRRNRTTIILSITVIIIKFY